jgi:hypothetical protein
MDHQTLFRTAGISAAVATIALVVAGITLGLFFAGAGAFWGPVNDVFVTVTFVALLLPIVAVDRLGSDAAPWIRIVSVIVFAACVVTAVGQIALVVGVISLQTSFVTFGIGTVGILIWLFALIALTFGAGVLTGAIGWMSVAMLVAIVAGTVVGFVGSGLALWGTAVVVAIVIVAWLGSLSAGLLASPTTATATSPQVEAAATSR